MNLNLGDWLRRAPRRRKARAFYEGPFWLLSGGTGGRAPRDYHAAAVEGYQSNPIVFRAVRMVAEAAASIPILLYRGPEELAGHPALDLLRMPHPSMDGTGFLETLFTHLEIAGEAFIEAAGAPGAPPEALYALRPDRLEAIIGPRGTPVGYRLKTGEGNIEYDLLAADFPPILHIALYNPLAEHQGFAPLVAAGTAIDIHNASAAWARALLENAARPSGALVLSRDGHLSDEQFERLKSELESGFTGAGNAGRPMLLEGGLDWKPLSLTPHDMDFLNAKHSAAREISLALGVPPMLLGIPGDNTYANYREANLAFWRQTVVPMAARVLRALSAFLLPRYEQGLRFELDLDGVPALAMEREAIWARINAASFLTDAEKREALGWPSLPDGEEALKRAGR